MVSYMFMISFCLLEILIYFLRTLKLTDVFGTSSEKYSQLNGNVEEDIYPQLMALKLGCLCQTLQSESHGQPSED